MRDVAEQSIPYIQPAIQKELSTQVYYEKWKRFFDICGALAGIFALSIVFIIVATLIKLEDPKGRIFFSQVRVGRNGKEFKMYKFRSMVHDAEDKLAGLLKYNEVSGAMFKMKNDPRITRIGRFIRKTSLDELPQLFNVLQGNMSLVGPRPPLAREVEEYTPHHLQRLLVVPGCTGLWQCSARNSVGFEEMVDLDIKYIINRSMYLDLKIILLTIRTLITSKNAY